MAKRPKFATWLMCSVAICALGISAFAAPSGPSNVAAVEHGPVQKPVTELTTNTSPVLLAVPGSPKPIEQRQNALLARLFENVSYWAQRGQPEISVRELERILLITPRDPNIIAIAARLAFQIGNFQRASEYRDRLREVAPLDSRLAALSAERLLTPEESEILKQARALSVSDKKEDAIARYREIFKNDVPDSLAVEFYTTLGTTSIEGFQEASDRLRLVAQRWPDDPSLRLALAKLQTYQEQTQPAGIATLRELTQLASVAVGAKAAWREALLWHGPDAEGRDQIKEYLAAYPDDVEMTAKLAAILKMLPSEGLVDRMLAYEAGAAGKHDEAERGFLAALKFDPNDSEAMIMLSLIRRGQKRLSESDSLIAKALELSPERREEYVKDLGFDPATLARDQAAQRAAAAASRGRSGVNNYRGDGGAAIARNYARVNSLADMGDFAGAIGALSKLLGPKPAVAGRLQMAYLQLRAGQFPAAEANFRSVMAAVPRLSEAAIGLATVLEREGRSSDAEDVLARSGTPGALPVRQLHATLLRDRAKAEVEPAKRLTILREAFAEDPASPWARLELARAYDSSRQHGLAVEVMRGAVSPVRPEKDQLKAALIYAEESGDLARAAELIDMMPAKARTPEMQATRGRVNFQAELAAAKAGPDRETVRARLMQIASLPDPTGERGTAVAKVLISLNDRGAARQALQAGLSKGGNSTPLQRLVYSGSLMAAGFVADAAALASTIKAEDLQPSDRAALEGVRNGLAIVQSDGLNSLGKRSEAYRLLAPQLAKKPQSPELNLALSRLYVAGNKPEEGLRITEGVLLQQPEDLDVRRAAVGSAVQANELARAAELVEAARRMAPGDARTLLMEADLRRANNHPERALAILRKAREVHLREVEATGTSK